MKYIVLIALACAQVLLATLLWYKKHSKVSQIFILYAINMSIWTIANVVLDYYQYNVETSLAFLGGVNGAGFFLGTLSLIVVYRLSLIFPVQVESTKTQLRITVAGVFMSFLTLLPVVSGTFQEGEGGSAPVYMPGAAIAIVAAYTLFIAAASIRNLLIASRSANLDVKKQGKTIFSGLIITIIFGVFFITLSPIIVGDERFLFMGYYAPFIFTGSITYSIVRQKFLDFRLIVARSLGYILTLGTLVGIYVLAVFGLSSSVLGTGTLTGVQQGLYVVATLIFGFSLAPLKRFFDKLTNRLFYRDAYDAPQLLDRLNKVLVGNVDLDVILKQTADIMATTLKADYVAFLIRETKGTSKRASFSRLVELNTEDILAIKGKEKDKTELFVADEIEDDQDRVKHVLDVNNIAIAAKLAGSGTDDQGFLLLGAKQSGNPYNKQDLQLLDIIANELVIAIQNALRFEEIETFSLTLQQKVNDATRQLRQTNDKLKALDETKDEFISMASHQLRTPLTAVKGYVSMVVEGDAGKLNKQQKELLDQAFASSQRMVYLIADLLNVSRLQSGKFVIENKPTQLSEVVASEMEQLTEVAKGKDQTLTYVKPDKFPELMLDETKIRQVIMNFADNALHYTQAGGHIQINLEDKGDSIEYTVVDDGLGVPKAEQHHLFTKFYRAGNAKKARPDGTGLGLFMAKKVVVAQGGAIIFKSEESKGSTFGFTFPKAKMLVPATSSDKGKK